jgi:hypothetical protein
VNAAEDQAVFVDGDVIVFLEAMDEVVSVGLADDFNAKVVDNEVKGGGAGDVAEEAWCVAGGDVSIGGEVLD